jgi:NAD(P)-dependent dehydrogenase (short-subunit alcohol dehydrogenase family)
MENKSTVFITGGNGEIGKAIAVKFREEGFNVIAPGSKQLDCSSAITIENYFKNFPAKQIDVFVHCAGINNPKSFVDVTAETLSSSLHINTFSFLLITQRLMPYLNKSVGYIAAISSIYGSISRNKRLEYATSKHSLIGMVKSLALELAPKKSLSIRYRRVL